MANQNLEHAFLSVLNAGGIQILGDSKKFIAYMADVTKGRVKKYDAIKVLLNNRYLEFFTSIGKPGEARASDVVESATEYACENLGIDREMAFQVSVDMIHALEEFQGLQKTSFLQQKPNPKPRRQIPIEKEPEYVPETVVNAPPSNNTKKTSMTIVAVILWVVILVAAAFFVWKTFVNKDSENTTEVAKIDQGTPSASLAAEPGTTQTETVAETQTPSPSVTTKDNFDFVPERFQAANDVYLGMFVYQYNLDQSDVLEMDDYPYMYYRVPQANSKNELMKYCKQYYTESVVEQIVRSHDYIEQNGKLYMDRTMGLGDTMISKVEITVSKTSDTTLAVTYLEYYEYAMDDPTTNNVNLIYMDGNWVWDGIIGCNTEFELIYK